MRNPGEGLEPPGRGRVEETELGSQTPPSGWAEILVQLLLKGGAS